MKRPVIREILAAAGAVGGGMLGVAAFAWMLRYNLYALILPGAMLGAGCGSLSATRSNIRGGLCAAAGLAVGMYAKWRHFGRVDETFGHYVLDIARQPPTPLLMLVVGGAAAFYFGRDAFVPLRRKPAGVDVDGLGRKG